MESHHVNDENDQVEGVEDPSIDEFLDLIGDEIYFINEGGDLEMILDGDAIDDILEEKYDYWYLGYQMVNHVEKWITKRLDTMAWTSVLLPRDLTIDDTFDGVSREQVHTWTNFIPKIGRNTLRDVDDEHVSFHLEKKWETTRGVQEKKTYLEIEWMDKFDTNHEVGCSLMIELDGGQSFNTLTFLECSFLGHTHET